RACRPSAFSADVAQPAEVDGRFAPPVLALVPVVALAAAAPGCDRLSASPLPGRSGTVRRHDVHGTARLSRNARSRVRGGTGESSGGTKAPESIRLGPLSAACIDQLLTAGGPAPCRGVKTRHWCDDRRKRSAIAPAGAHAYVRRLARSDSKPSRSQPSL